MRQTDANNLPVVTRRTMVLAGAKAAVLSVIFGRVYQLQVLEAERYTQLAEQNRLDTRLISPIRGRITDRFGHPLAQNEANFRAVLTLSQLRGRNSAARVIQSVTQVLAISKDDQSGLLRNLKKRQPQLKPLLIKENLSWNEVARLSILKPSLPGLQIEEGITRYYPFADITAHIVGYVGAVTDADLAEDEKLLSLPGLRLGKKGVERIYDSALRGTPEERTVEVDAIGREKRVISRVPDRPGDQLVLSLDMGLQRFAAERIAPFRAGCAIVMNAHDGDVLAMVSVPSFDPNLFARGVPTSEWQILTQNLLSPLLNKCTSGLYNPGSIFKMTLALAGLESGIDPNETVHCPGYLVEGTTKRYCWRKYGHGAMNMRSALVQSCDVYFYTRGLALGVDRIAVAARKLGMGKKAGLDLYAEQAGLVPTKAWKRTIRSEPWLPGDTMVLSIGQGFILTTPLQLATMMARLVNGGHDVQPRLAIGRIQPDGHIRSYSPDLPRELAIAAEHRRFIQDAMVRVVNTPVGTGYRSRLTGNGMSMGGKTGTAQVRRITVQERLSGVRKNVDLAWERRDHAMFVGFAPIDDPRYVVAVLIEHGGSGGAVAAPIARDLITQTLRRDPSRGRSVISGSNFAANRFTRSASQQ